MKRRVTGRAKWRPKRTPGKMNKTEARYEQVLLARQAAGEVSHWYYEPQRFRLGPDWKTSYLPDFVVYLSSGEIECIDVKGSGGWEEAARVKIKACAEKYPEYHWIGEKEKRRGVFEREVF